MIVLQLDELVGAYPNYNEEEEERRYYRRKRLGVVKNVLAASVGGMLTYGVYLGRADLRTLLSLRHPHPLPLPRWERETLRPAGLLPLSLPGSELLLPWSALGTGKGGLQPSDKASGWAWSSFLLTPVLVSIGKGRLGDSAACQPCLGPLFALSWTA